MCGILGISSNRSIISRLLLGLKKLEYRGYDSSGIATLDQDIKQSFLELLFNEVKKSNSALLFVSHDLTLSSLFDRSVSLNDINSSISA